MSIPVDWPTGRLTMRSEPGGVPGEALTADELAVDVLATATGLGFETTPGEYEATQRVTKAGEARLVGTVTVDPARSATLAAAAERAVAWLNEHAPEGKRFVVRDGLWLETT